MVSKGAVVVLGLVALAACAGCATGPRSVVVDPSASDAGQASPPAVGDQISGCEGSSYNRAAGLCVWEGA